MHIHRYVCAAQLRVNGEHGGGDHFNHLKTSAFWKRTVAEMVVIKYRDCSRFEYWVISYNYNFQSVVVFFKSTCKVIYVFIVLT